ncbi:MAG TPA: hypothetical protein VGG34_14340 [Opitutaceae bacterium]|jgi:hypothetical protein
MLRALIFLRLVSFRNLVVHRMARLRQPKYLVAAAAAASYVYYFLVRPVARMPAGNVAGNFSATADIACGVLCAMALARIAYCWAVPAENPGLVFSEAEIAFLFPAPLTRRMLVQYRLLSSQLLILLTAVIVTVVANRGAALGGGRLIHTVGWWVILSTLDLHINGTKLAIGRLRQAGARLLAWRIGALAAIGAYVAALAWSARVWLDAATPNLDAMVFMLKRGDAFHWLTLPFRIVVGPYYSATLPEFARALAPALLFLGLHYLWVLNSGTSFEEGSIALAEKRAAIRAAISRGAAPRLSDRKQKALPGPFPLAPRGLPETAFLWKNLLSMRSSLFSRRALVILLAVSAWAGLLVTRHPASSRGGLGEIVLIVCGVVAAYTIIFGPQLARQDLRSDLANADILKTFPIEGWRLALGELLAPAAILTAILWALIAAAAAATGPGQGLATAERATAAACLAAVAPVLCVIQLIVPNTLVVLMPGWYQASRNRTAGVEVFGQRLVFSLMQFLISLLVLVPAAAVAVLVCFCSYRTLSLPGGMLLGCAFALFMLGGEAAVGLWYLGERFERLDLSTDTR